MFCKALNYEMITLHVSLTLFILFSSLQLQCMMSTREITNLSNECPTYKTATVWETLSYDLSNTLHVQIFQINVQLRFAFINAHWSIKVAFGEHRSLATCLVLPRIFPPRHLASFATKKRTTEVQIINNEGLQILVKEPAKIRSSLEFWKVAPQFFYEPAIQGQFARLQSYFFSWRRGHSTSA